MCFFNNWIQRRTFDSLNLDFCMKIQLGLGLTKWQNVIDFQFLQSIFLIIAWSYIPKFKICQLALLNQEFSFSILAYCDISIGSIEIKYIKLNTKTQNIFCCVNENLTTFLYTLTGGTRKEKFSFLKCIQNSNVIFEKCAF